MPVIICGGALLRIYTIQRVEFVPSVHVLVQTLVFSIILLLLLLKTEVDPAAALLFGFITYVFDPAARAAVRQRTRLGG